MSLLDFDFSAVLGRMVETHASDVHITPGFPPAMRDKGKIVPMEGFPVLNGQQTREVVYGILNDDQRKRFENNKQLDFAYAIPGVARFRVNCFFQRGTVSAAFRLVPQQIPALDSLGVPPVLRELAEKPRGFVLVTGPTGSGKSTTLAAMIDLINASRQDHILTIEDPIEFLHTHKQLDRQPARDRLRRARLRARAARRPARGPRRDPGRRDEGPGDDLDRADRGRDRPPGLRHPPHPVDRADRRPDHRRLPGRAAGPGADPALDRPAGDRHPAAAADPRRARARRRLRGAGADAGDPQPDPRGQNAPDLRRRADLRRGRDADDGRRPGAAGADRQDRPGAGRTARLGAGGAEPAARRAAARPATAVPSPAPRRRAPRPTTWRGPRRWPAPPPSSSGRWTSPARPPTARSRPNRRPRSASSCASAG